MKPKYAVPYKCFNPYLFFVLLVRRCLEVVLQTIAFCMFLDMHIKISFFSKVQPIVFQNAVIENFFLLTMHNIFPLFWQHIGEISVIWINVTFVILTQFEGREMCFCPVSFWQVIYRFFCCYTLLDWHFFSIFIKY